MRFSGYSAPGPGLAATAAALYEPHSVLNGVILVGPRERVDVRIEAKAVKDELAWAHDCRSPRLQHPSSQGLHRGPRREQDPGF